MPEFKKGDPVLVRRCKYYNFKIIPGVYNRQDGQHGHIVEFEAGGWLRMRIDDIIHRPPEVLPAQDILGDHMKARKDDHRVKAWAKMWAIEAERLNPDAGEVRHVVRLILPKPIAEQADNVVEVTRVEVDDLQDVGPMNFSGYYDDSVPVMYANIAVGDLFYPVDDSPIPYAYMKGEGLNVAHLISGRASMIAADWPSDKTMRKLIKRETSRVGCLYVNLTGQISKVIEAKANLADALTGRGIAATIEATDTNHIIKTQGYYVKGLRCAYRNLHPGDTFMIDGSEGAWFKCVGTGVESFDGRASCLPDSAIVRKIMACDDDDALHRFWLDSNGNKHPKKPSAEGMYVEGYKMCFKQLQEGDVFKYEGRSTFYVRSNKYRIGFETVQGEATGFTEGTSGFAIVQTAHPVDASCSDRFYINDLGNREDVDRRSLPKGGGY